MEFGEILTLPEPGVRPEWLADDVIVRWGYADSPAVNHQCRAGVLTWAHANGENDVAKIRLPLDHFAYAAIAAGFTPWGGGRECGPDAWDGGEVLLSNGLTSTDYGRNCTAWSRTPGDLVRAKYDHFIRIIGYRKRAPAFLFATGSTDFLVNDAGDRRWMPLNFGDVIPPSGSSLPVAAAPVPYDIVHLAFVQKMTRQQAESRFAEVTGWPASRMIKDGLIDFLSSLNLIVADDPVEVHPAPPAYFHLGAEADA